MRAAAAIFLAAALFAAGAVLGVVRLGSAPASPAPVEVRDGASQQASTPSGGRIAVAQTVLERSAG